MAQKFRYLSDPLFLFSAFIYLVNKSVLLFWDCGYLKFGRFYLNDLLLVPVLVPVILFFSKMLRCRTTDAPPTFLEIFIPVIIWSVAFEYVGPFYFGKGTSDMADILAYCSGGLMSWIYWNRRNFLFRKY